MGAQHSRGHSLLVLLLGITVLWSAGGVGGLDATVNQYTAFEVSHEDGELELTNVDSGETRRGDRGSRTVDEEIVCLPTASRECSLARQEYDGEINSSGISSAFRYAYLDDEFYRLSNVDDFEYEFERTDAADAFAALALDSDRLTEREREVLDEGRISVAGSVLRTNELLEDDGRYYTIERTGTNTGSVCSSGGDDFCEEADALRRGNWVLGIGATVLGLLGILVGGRGLLRSVTGSESSG